MLNRITIMGRLVRDPELNLTTNGVAVAKFTLACERDRKDADGNRATDFIDCVAWRNTAEFVCKYLSKGRMAVAEGRLQIREWKDKDGNNRRTAEIVAENIYFGDSKREGDTAPSASPAYGAPPSSGFADIPNDDGDLPF